MLPRFDLQVSDPSRVLLTLSQLSQQLRTRLSYAMVKVQNGWQSNTLDEVESLASQYGSPRSSTSHFARPSDSHHVQSPRTLMQANTQRKWSSSESSDGIAASQAAFRAAQRLDSNGAHLQSAARAPSLRPSLAPPADIIPGTRRRPPPNVSTNGYHVSGPYTPSRHISTLATSKQRTPSQNAAMEADAVETLLFMASPGNSGYHPTTTAATESSLRTTAPLSAQTSPLRSQFYFNDPLVSPRRSLGFADSAGNDPRSVDLSSEINDIERMLDDSDEDSSDGLDEAVDLAKKQESMRSTHI